MKICTVIVTYNRLDELEKCIEANLLQTVCGDILIVDNASTDNISIILEKYKNNKQIKYIRLTENLGGAGGFYYGMKIAFEKGGYDAVWLMDDDGRPDQKDCLEALIDCVHKINRNDYILNSLVRVNEKELSFNIFGEKRINRVIKKASFDNCIIGEINPFNGTLVSKETYERIGLPRKEYFIKQDEVEYMWRALKNNIFVATCVTSIFFHPTISIQKKRFLGRNIAVIDESYWKLYYRARNTTVNLKLYKTKQDIFWHVIQTIYSAIYAKGDKCRKIRYSFAGLLDGFRGVFHRIKI